MKKASRSPKFAGRKPVVAKSFKDLDFTGYPFDLESPCYISPEESEDKDDL